MMSKLFIFALLLAAFSSTSYAANITISAGECYTINENLSVCTPGMNINATAAYQSCIADTKAYFNTTLFLERLNFTDSLTTLNSAIENANFSYVNKYSECTAQLNVTKTFMDTCSDRLRNETTENDLLRLNASFCGDFRGSLESVQEELTKEKDGRNLQLVAAFIAGIAAYYFYAQSEKKTGKGMMEGTAPKAF